MNNSIVHGYLAKARQAARQAGRVILQAHNARHKDDINYNEKNVGDFVTEIDIKAELEILQVLQSSYPDHNFVSEEHYPLGTNKNSLYTWFIDPIDGTNNFITGNPYFGPAIALQYKDQTILGLVYNPVLDMYHWAIKGEGAWREIQGMIITLRNRKESPVKICLMGFEFYQINYEALSNQFPGRVRVFGALAHDLCTVADGRAAALFRQKIGEMHKWDYLAGQLICQEAGLISTIEYKEIDSKKSAKLVTADQDDWNFLNNLTF